jgi:exopolysaccharide biosynthesis polyprenyl glycosylphosphotransferase
MMNADSGAVRHSGARRFLWLLGASDVLLAAAGWLCVARWSGVAAGHPAEAFSLVLYVVLTLLFFPFYHLYNPHLFYDKGPHLVTAIKALLQAGAVFALLSAAYTLPMAWILAALGAALVVLLIDWRWVHFLRSGPFHLFRVAGVVLLALGVLGTVYWGGPPPLLIDPPRTAAGFGLGAAALLLGRLFVVHVVAAEWLRRGFRRQVLVWGADGQAQEIVRHVIAHNAPFYVTGTVGDGCVLAAGGVSKQCLGRIEELPAITAAHPVDELVITDPAIDKRALILVLDFCTSAGVRVWLTPALLPIVDIKLQISHFCGLPMIRMGNTGRLWLANKLKHTLDAVLGLPILLALLPLFAVIGAAIKLSSPGPIFYVSARIGKNGREFPMYKFRSMYVNNDDRVHKDYVTKLIKGEITADSAGGQPLKIVNDPRVTRVGEVLRKWSLDELPQILNVIRGDMSLVGPRPCLPYEYEMYQEWYKKRNAVRPGITGLWQVAGRSEVDFEDAILLDLYYVYNRGVWMDVNILIETVGVVIGKRGAH